MIFLKYPLSRCSGEFLSLEEETLYISIHTVKTHVYNLYRKLKVKNRHQLIHLISTSEQEKA